MNLPTTAQNLKPEQWQQVMRLIHPDNVEETLRILHAHQPMLKALTNLAKLRVAHALQVPQDTLDILDNEPSSDHPWPPEPKPELEETEPARA